MTAVWRWWTAMRSRRATVLIRSGSAPLDGRVAEKYEIGGKRAPVDWKAARNLAQRT